MRRYIVFFLDPKRQECRRVVTATDRRQAIRKFLKNKRCRLLTILNVQEA